MIAAMGKSGESGVAALRSLSTWCTFQKGSSGWNRAWISLTLILQLVREAFKSSNDFVETNCR